MPGKSFYIVRKLIYFCNFKKVTGFVLRPGRDDRIDNTRGNCMKKILSVITLTVLIASCGQDRKARVQGSFSGLSHDTVLLEMVTTQGRRIVDSTVIDQGGDFRFRVKLPEKGPVFYNLLCDGSAIPLIVTPGDRIEVNSLCDLARNYTVEGSEESQLLKQFNTQYGNGVATLDSLSKIYRNTPVVADTEKRRKNLLDQYLAEYYRIKREHIAFIMAHPSSMAAVYALYQRLPDDPWLFNEKTDLIYYRIVADSSSVRYPDASRVKVLQKEIEERKKVLELADRIQNQSGNALNYPEIDLHDVYGKDQKLSSLDGKTILVSFWSTRDSRYPVQNAEMRELYKTYKDRGLAIYQVSLDDEKADWVTVVQDQKLPWINVFDPRGTGGIAAMSYNVQAVPSNVLISSDGAIVARNLFGDQLKNKVAELVR